MLFLSYLKIFKDIYYLLISSHFDMLTLSTMLITSYLNEDRPLFNFYPEVKCTLIIKDFVYEFTLSTSVLWVRTPNK